MTSSDLRTLFIGGSGRSGTSVTRRLVGLHPEAVSLPFEHRFLVDPDGIVDFYRSYEATWTPYLADRRLRRLERLLRQLARSSAVERVCERVLRRLDPRGRWFTPPPYAAWELGRHLPNFTRHVDAVLEELTSFTFSATWVGARGLGVGTPMRHAPPRSRTDLCDVLGRFVRRVLIDFVQSREGSLYVEDNTWNVLVARELSDLVPGAKFLHVYRDPRDVVASYMEQRWAPEEAGQAARWYADILNHWWEIRRGLPEKCVLELSLEQLVSSPRDTAERICAFVDLEFDEKMLGLSLDRAHRGRWRRDLDAREQEIVQQILDSYIQRLGYA